MKSALIACLLAVAVPLAAGTAPAVTLTLPYQTILPGVPFEATVQYTNATDHRLAIGTAGTLTIQSADGTSHTFHVTVTHDIDAPNVELEPGAAQTGNITWDQNLFFEDATVTAPGTYVLTLDLSGNADVVEDGTTLVDHARTAPVRLTRINPSGDEALLWQRMQAASWPSHGFGARVTQGTAIEHDILTKYADSAYYPYALLLGRQTRKYDVGIAADAATRFTDSPAYPHLLLAAAISEAGAARRAEQEHRAIADVVVHYQRAVMYNQRVQSTGYEPLRIRAALAQRSAEGDLEHLRAAKREQ